MFWADRIAQELKDKGPQWVDDMKTPSGRIHVGALRGVVIHDLVYKSLQKAKIPVKYTYLFEDQDPMDALPTYLSKEKFGKYLGMPLYKIPPPQPGFKNYAEYYARDFLDTFNAIGCHPEIIWTTSLYLNGKMNDAIKECLNKADIIRDIYGELYAKKIPKDWYPFQTYCPKCGKVSTTKAYNWDGEKVSFVCEIDGLDWVKGCGFKGKVSPFSDKTGIAGKLPWKVEWPAKWKVLGVTVEGAGKDHMSSGGSHDFAKLICERVLNYPVPYPIAYEWFLIEGRKMSSSKGVGFAASETLSILPPEILRFLMVKTRINQQINFDPRGETIPKLFDEYQKAAEIFFGKKNDDLARIFELSQIGKPKKPPKIRFSHLAQWVQMPNMEEAIKKEGLEEWSKYAKIWLEKYAPEEKKFVIQKTLPDATKNLSAKQRQLLLKISQELDKEWKPEDFQNHIYKLGKDLGLSSTQTFQAIYLTLLGKNHGPKASWLILSLDKNFIQNRFNEVLKKSKIVKNGIKIKKLNKPEIFYIDDKLKDTFPSMSVGIAVIKGVNINKKDDNLEKEKKELLPSLQELSTEKLGQYPEIVSYRKLYKEMGIDWHSRRPSPEALLRRVVLNKGLYSINTCVDAYNLVVMKNRVSVGAFNLDNINFPTVLRFAKEGEEILLLGDNRPTKYKKSEVAYFDEIGGYNIDFNYRDAQRTAVQLDTKNLYINVDGIYEITPQKVEEVLEATCNIITKYCGGKIELFGVETK